MCRSIKTLRGQEDPATHEEVQAAALQFVRKISGYRVPSAANENAFNEAGDEIAAVSSKLLGAWRPGARVKTSVSLPYSEG